MKAEHFPSLLEIEKECFPIRLLREDFLRSAGQGLSFTAAAGGDTLGYLLAEKVLDECHIIRIAVREGMREKGIGKGMMEKLFEEAKTKGIKKYYLEVRASNSAARGFYRKMGFAEAYTRKKYYADNNEDAVFMEKIQGTCPDLSGRFR
jgi:ribosomal-protein-alanine N-acetyltransferase